MDKSSLSPEDPTFFAGCPNCNKRGLGMKIGNYYSKAFTKRRWVKNPVCENCETLLVLLFEIEVS